MRQNSEDLILQEHAELVQQNKKNKKKIAHWCNLFVWFLPIIICVKIFLFSAQTAEESTGVSMPITIRIVTGVSRALHEDLNENEVLTKAENLEFFVRKAGHMGEYAILAISILLSFVVCFSSLSKKNIWYTLFYCLFYAATDEIHQLFVQGRAGRITDVGIDFVGSILGFLFFWLLYKIWIKHRMKH